jgi:alginate O-acetyltransferase complex protein AlgI
MVFSSLIFLCVFLPLSLGFYYLIKNRTYKNWVLIITSLLFYAWGEPVWVLMLLFSTFFNYFAGLVIGNNQGNWKAKAAIIISVIENIIVLGFFKYSGFIADNLNNLLGTSIKIIQLGLPVGISFYTFKLITYVVDVYRGEAEPQRSPFKLLMYVSLFHQIMSGPIEKYSDFSYYIDNREETPELFNEGAARFIAGLGKKAVFANTAGKIVDVFMGSDYSGLSVSGAWLGIIMFTLQLYFDFSGYSDMAIGLGMMFGFKFKENFDYPYISRSATEFWRKWHISLGNFFKEYVYIPLGGNRKHHIRNLFITWLLTGLWHGSNWNFVVWGIYYFILLVIEKKFLLKVFEKIPAIFSRIYLWLVTVVGWVFFYHTDIIQAFNFLGIMFGLKDSGKPDPMAGIYFWNNAVFLLAALIGSTPMAKNIMSKIKQTGLKQKSLRAVANICLTLIYTGILVISVIFLVGQSYSPFLYFKF